MARHLGQARRATGAQVRIVWPAPALADLTAIRAYIAEHNPTAAMQVAADIKAAAKALADFPHMGHEGEDGTREWIVTRRRDYVLVYDVDEDADVVIILRVWHQKQDR